MKNFVLAMLMGMIGIGISLFFIVDNWMSYVIGVGIGLLIGELLVLNRMQEYYGKNRKTTKKGDQGPTLERGI